ncbi:MAG: hypothetical protein IIZ25_08805 [Thermoguttaceae bacterium]|nr:hypothetical protein [Thermoguttaceae bacterium]
MCNKQSTFRFDLKTAAVIGAAAAFFCAVFSLVPQTSVAQENPEQLTNPAVVAHDLLTLLPDDTSQGQGLSASPNFAPAAEDPVPQGAAADVSDSDTPFERIAPEQQPACAAMSAKESPWCRFRPGSWSRTRTVSVSFQHRQSIQSVTEKKQTLLDISASGYTLRQEVSVKMGNRTFEKEPEVVKYNFYGLAADDQLTEEILPSANVQAGLRVIPCFVRRFQRTTPEMTETTTLWYSTVISPFIHQSHTDTFSNDTPRTLLRQASTTILFQGGNLLIGADLPVWFSQTIEKKEDSVSLTRTIHSTMIPGGVQRQVTVETDPAGGVLYQSTTTLLDYYIERSY